MVPEWYVYKRTMQSYVTSYNTSAKCTETVAMRMEKKIDHVIEILIKDNQTDRNRAVLLLSCHPQSLRQKTEEQKWQVAEIMN